jgi:hypothetical protein
MVVTGYRRWLKILKYHENRKRGRAEMARSTSSRGLSRVALDYAAIAAIGLGILALFIGYPRRGAELLIAGTGLLVFKYLLGRLGERRSITDVEIYRNVVLVNSDGCELPSRLIHLSREDGFTLGQAGEQLKVGEAIQIRSDHFEAYGRIRWVNGAWAGGKFTDGERLLHPVSR